MGIACSNPTEEIASPKTNASFSWTRDTESAGPDLERTFADERREYDDSGIVKFKMAPILATSPRLFVHSRRCE
jgi:hypothetical protein